MANIALVTESTSHAAFTTTKSALEGLGHTVTGFTMTAVTSSNLATFDIIMLARVVSTATGHADLATNLQGYMNTHHIPVLIGMNAIPVTNTDSAGMATLLKLISQASVQASRGPNVYASSAHPVWVDAAITPPVSVPVWSGTSFMGWVNGLLEYAGEVIATAAVDNTNPTMILAERGSLDITGTPFGARIAYIGWLYGAATYSVSGLTLLQALIDWAINPPAYVQGVVEDFAGTKLARVVRAYNRTTGRLAGSAMSDGASGAFSISVSDPAAVYYVVALDELSGTLNALIKDRIIPYSE